MRSVTARTSLGHIGERIAIASVDACACPPPATTVATRDVDTLLGEDGVSPILRRLGVPPKPVKILSSPYQVPSIEQIDALLTQSLQQTKFTSQLPTTVATTPRNFTPVDASAAAAAAAPPAAAPPMTTLQYVSDSAKLAPTAAQNESSLSTMSLDPRTWPRGAQIAAAGAAVVGVGWMLMRRQAAAAKAGGR